MPDLTLRQLEFLTAVAAVGSFRKAAQRCGVTQPSLSAQIKALEARLKVQLVERSAAGAVLTPEGRRIHEAAIEVLDRVRALEETAHRGPLSGVLRVGVKATLGPYLMPSVAGRLHKTYPDLRLFVSEAAPLDLEAELLAGRHDLILAQLPVPESDFHSISLFREPLLLAVAADDPLAGKAAFEPSDLRGRDVLTLSPRFHLHDQVLRLCETNGAVLRRDYEGSSLDALRQMVAMGLGATLLPALYVASEVEKAEDVVAIPQRRLTLFRTIGLVWRRTANRIQAIDILADVIREAARVRPSIIIAG